MRQAEVQTYSVTIYLSGDAAQARQACREFTYGNSLCVWVTEGTYIYVGGEELGVSIRLVNYPRFPSEPGALWAKAKNLAEHLRVRLFQHSYMLESPDRTEWFSWRDENPAARG